jgi:hypothetical protein
MKLLALAFTVFIPTQHGSSNKHPQVENYKAIDAFSANAKNFNPTTGTHKFKKTILLYDATGGKLVTYSLSGDTIQYFKSGSKQFLYFCKFSNPSVFAGEIPFFSKNKKTLVPGKYLKNNSIVLTDIEGFQALELEFSQEKIKTLVYRVFPD